MEAALLLNNGNMQRAQSKRAGWMWQDALQIYAESDRFRPMAYLLSSVSSKVFLLKFPKNKHVKTHTNNCTTIWFLNPFRLSYTISILTHCIDYQPKLQSIAIYITAIRMNIRLLIYRTVKLCAHCYKALHAYLLRSSAFRIHLKFWPTVQVRQVQCPQLPIHASRRPVTHMRAY